MKSFLILGLGCWSCQELTANTESAAKELGMEYELTKVTDLTAIKRFGVRWTPALAVDGRVVAEGKVPSVEELKGLLRQAA